MKIWVDDIREKPSNFDIHCKSVYEFKHTVNFAIDHNISIELISLDHDSGEYFTEGGDYIECLKWLEEIKMKYNYEPCTVFKLHTFNPVGRINMIQIIKKMNWNLV